jgi:FMN phosphatase YigB (HAD superfamily)
VATDPHPARGANPFIGATAVVVDVFGTLIDVGSDLDVSAAIRRVLVGASRDEAADIPWTSVYEPYDLAKIMDYRGQLTSRQLWDLFLKQHLQRRNAYYYECFTVPREVLIGRLHAAELALYRDASLIPGSTELLRRTRRAGLRTTLCSNATASGYATIVRLGLVGSGSITCDDQAISCLAGYDKLPEDGAVSLFSWLADPMRLDPYTTVVVEDEERYIRAAARRGFRTVLVGPASQNGTQADLRVNDLAELTAMLPTPATA